MEQGKARRSDHDQATQVEVEATGLLDFQQGSDVSDQPVELSERVSAS
jgi:hypothetical protein